MPTCIAVLDDDLMFASTLVSLLIEDGYTAVSATRSEAGYAMVRDIAPDVLVISVHRDGLQDWPVLDQLPHDLRTATIPVIICAHDRFALRGHGTFLRERGYLVLERFNMQELLTALEQVLGPQPSQPL